MSRNVSDEQRVMGRGSKLLVLVTFLACLSLALAACTVKTQEVPIQTQEKNNQDSGAMEQPAVKVETPETKTAQEKTEEIITNLVADGTYEDNVTYRYHSGPETFHITLTLQNDVVIEAAMSTESTNKVSLKFIGGVKDSLPELVIGKKINEINLPKQISGSSLTTAALKGYLEQLIEEQQA